LILLKQFSIAPPAVTQSGHEDRARSIDRGIWQSVRTPLSNEIVDTSGQIGRAALIALDNIADGGLAEAEAAIDGDAESVILHRQGQEVRAWLNICPHAGRRLDWAPGQFLKSRDGLLVCAVHGASFELGRGECVAGPCRGEALRPVAVEVRDGQVFLAQ
jgi:nitrite reductase/ring-hydroxylating ferredoxin subunit